MTSPPPVNTRRFAAVEPAYRNATVAPYIVRPLFFILTVVLLVSAAGQLGGRIIFANLERLEPRLNALLAEQGIAVSGLSGDWRFFNPILKIASLKAPGVDTSVVWAEIDTLESLARNRVVLRNAAADEVRLSLVQDEAGIWSLEGQAPSNNTFDWRSLLWHSDQLDVQVYVGVRAFGRPASELDLNLNFSNFGGRHRGIVSVADVDGCGSCGLKAQYNVEEAALWFRERQGGAVVRAENFELRGSLATLAGLSYLKLGDLDGRLLLQGERFSGPLSLLDSEVRLPGGKTTGLSLLAEGWSIDDGSTAALQVNALQLAGAGNVLDVRDALLNWAVEDGALLLVPQVNVGAITDVVGNMLAEDSSTTRWIRRLGMSGTFTRLLASWSGAHGIGFGGDFHNVYMQSVGGVPSIAQLEGSFTGGPKYLQLRLQGADARVGFPQLYRDEKDYASLTGQILMYFGQGYFGLEGSNLHLVDSNMVTTGSFSLASTKPLTNNHITLALASNAKKFSDITPYIPYKLPQEVLDWIANSAIRSELAAPSFVMHGPLREEESDMKRSYLVEAEMHDGELIFNTEWPPITGAHGVVKVSHTSISAELERATLAGMALRDMTIWLPAGAARVTAEGVATFDAATGLEFVRTTPLRESMDFVADDWWAEGDMQLDMRLNLPLDERVGNELDSRVKMRAAGRLLGTTFGMPEAGLVFTGMRGGLSYNYPYELSGPDIKGELFGRPMQMDISSAVIAAAPTGQPEQFAPRRMDFALAGKMHSDNMWPLIGMEPSDVVSGLFDFGAVYSTETDTGVLPSVTVETEFLGAGVNLPAPLGKLPDERALTVVSVDFGETEQRANLLYRGMLNADLGIADEGISGGHLRLLDGGLSSSPEAQPIQMDAAAAAAVDGATGFPPATAAFTTGGTSPTGPAGSAAERPEQPPGHPMASWDGVDGPIRIDGYLAFADVVQWAAGESTVELPPYEITGLNIGQATLGDVVLSDIALTGSSNSERLRLEFVSKSATGTLLVPETDLTELVLSEFIFESDDYDAEQATGAVTDLLTAGTELANEPIVDPVDPETMDSLEDMKVRIDALTVDGEDYGRWDFEIAREADGVAFRSLNALVKEVEVDSPDGVFWNKADNRTAFRGTLSGGDLGDVLEAWGYARSVESTSTNADLDLTWAGSPLNFELLQVRGGVASTVRTGRFLDVTGGNNTMRIFSLMNFNAIAKRMSLNFRDVFGRGISFEEVALEAQLDDGMLTFVRPLEVDGTGGDFKVNGRVNLSTGELDNEMVVTLPVNKSLPWLGAYLALANPVVGIGVLVGERLLRKPIKGLSSAKYRITGKKDDPQLELVSVFDRSIEDSLAESEVAIADQTSEVAEKVQESSPEPPVEFVPDVDIELESQSLSAPEPIMEDAGAESLQAVDSPEEVSQAN